MSSVNASSGYRDPHNPAIFIAEPHNFYSSDGTTNEPLFSSVDHITPQSDLSGLFIDSPSFPWPEIDGTEYSPGVYSDSDRQTGFSSGLSSNSSPDDYVDWESEYPQFGNGSDRNEDARYTAGLSPNSELQNFSEPESPFGGSIQTYLNEHSAYKNISPENPNPEQCVNLSQLVASGPVTQSLSVETVAPRSPKPSSSKNSNMNKKQGSDEDSDEEDELSDPSSSDYRPSPSPNAESKRSVRHHPYNTASRSKESSEAGGTSFRTILSRTRQDSDRPCAPVPVPVPNLTKKSRGRKVPTVHDPELESTADEYVPSGRLRDTTDGGRVKRGRGGGAIGTKHARTYRCTVEDCGKCFVRGEHLKRHIRSIHTHEKPHPCPYEGCDRTFSRRDNLGQHQRVHGM